MSIADAFVARVLDGLLWPFADRSPLLGLAVLSGLSSLGALIAIRALSDPGRLVAVKRSLQACVLEIRLLNDDVPAMWRAVGEMMRHTATYLRLLAAPAVCVAVPLGCLVSQLEGFYGSTGLEVGAHALVQVTLKSSFDADATSSSADPSIGPALALEAPAGIRIDTPAVWIPSLHELDWRITAERPGEYLLSVRAGEATFTKTLRVSQAIVRRSTVRPDAGVISQLLHPLERPLPDESPLVSIAVTYPRRDVTVLGCRVNWVVVFAGLSMAATLILRKPCGVAV